MSTFTQTITSIIVINGKELTTDNQMVIPNIDQYDNRLVNVPASTEITLVNFSNQNGPGQFIRGEMRYFQATNTDPVNYARIRMNKLNSYCIDFQVQPKGSLMLTSTNFFVQPTAATFINFNDIDTISAQANQSTVNLELVVVSV